MLVHSFPSLCLSGSVSIGFPQACLSLRVVTGSDNLSQFSEKFLLTRWFRCWRPTAAGIDDSPGTTRSTKLSTAQEIDFPWLASRGVSPFFHSNEYPCFEQSIWSNRTADVSSRNRSVTNRSKSRTKTSASSFIWESAVTVSGSSRSIPFLSELKSLFLSIVHFSRQIPRYFAVTICLSWGFLRCSFLKTGRAKIRSWRSPFGIIPPDCSFLSRILVS